MLITVDLGAEVPLYQQIRDQVVRAIAFGRLAVGEALPSTRQLGANLGINSTPSTRRTTCCAPRASSR